MLCYTKTKRELDYLDEHSKKPTILRGLLGDMGVALTRFRCGQIGLIFREKPSQDYGIDGEIEILSGTNPTGRLISVQIKCGPSYFSEANDAGFVFRFDAKHCDYWTNHALPVIGVLVDHENEICYWGNISKETTVSTGTGYKTTIPNTQILGQDFRQQLIDLATPVISESSYQILSEEDQSNAVARRISRCVRLNASPLPWTKHTIRQLILQTTSDARTSQYHRNEICSESPGITEADVVWTYVYRSENDRNLGAYIARAIWISPDLPLENHPTAWEGEIDVTGITIDWNDSFEGLVKFVDEQRSSKFEFMKYANAIIDSVELFLSKHYRATTTASDFKFVDFSAGYLEFKKELIEEPYPCHECDRLSERLVELLALIDNANIYSKRLTTEHKNTNYIQFKRYIDDVISKIRDAKYELSLVR